MNPYADLLFALVYPRFQWLTPYTQSRYALIFRVILRDLDEAPMNGE